MGFEADVERLKCIRMVVSKVENHPKVKQWNGLHRCSGYPKLKLTYFPFPGRAEPIRLALFMGGLAFEDERIGVDELNSRRSSLPFNQLPVLEVDGEMVSQALAILRYVGTLSGLYSPSNIMEMLRIDEVFSLIDEFYSSYTWNASYFEQYPMKQLQLRTTLAEETLPKTLGFLENRVSRWGGLHSVGDKLTVADLAIYSLLWTFQSGRIAGVPVSSVTMQLLTPLALACILFCSTAVAKSDEEAKTIDDLYADAVAEGGNLVLYHGGDAADRQDRLRNAFTQRFPEINFTVIVDYSKYHDVRIDNQLETDTLVPDVVALQTLQDFTRWTKEGELLPYKPREFSKIHNSLKDENGAWMAYSIYTFGYLYNSSALNGLAAPTTPADLADSQWAGKIASSYPHDDDAVLFVYARYVEKYGWDWVAKLAQQDIDFNRGSYVAGNLVTSGEKIIGVGTSGRPGTTPIEFVGGNGTDYLSWGQRVGILTKAKHHAAAKLFMNWIVSEEAQTSIVTSSVRTDINVNKPWDIPEANMAAFPEFMEDREKVEIWKQTFALYFGEVQGDPTPGWPGLHPGL
ncbi:hypothetical protein JM18_006159 [Phytophthora kernoviae]|uniref:GST N-terminal domain-containing protein n=2 Tax=Phytophthora kernoviae TaxID=325452 RepID=A0A921SEV0_9STRA|nr:hypothetical protein G195_007441 [Phytophthora kernoviae 00238/432]KAG2522412.1 hypothetical protein JM18_006159 [Phytophthora kernoviae]